MVSPLDTANLLDVAGANVYVKTTLAATVGAIQEFSVDKTPSK